MRKIGYLVSALLFVILVGGLLSLRSHQYWVPTKTVDLAEAQVYPGTAVLNGQTISAANVEASYTLTGATGMRVHVWAVEGICQAGVLGTNTGVSSITSLRITDGSTIVWNSATASSTNNGIGNPAQIYRVFTPMPLSGSAGNSVVVAIGACGTGATGTVSVQGDRY